MARKSLRRKNHYYKVIIILLVLLVVGGFLGFKKFGQNNSPETSDVVEENQNEEVENKEENVFEEKKELKIVNPNSKSRPYAVMINNIATARKYQSGLQDAYLIYEIIAEGGITRFLALFKDQTTSRIASIRSARHYFIDYALENDAIFVHWGWSTQAYNDLKNLKVDHIDGIDYENIYFKRDNTLNVAQEHRGYTTMELLQKATMDLKYRNETEQKLLLNYSIDSIDMANIPNAKQANKVNIKFSSSTTTNYVYDEEEKIYLRSVNDVANNDYVTKKQYNFKNIITYQVKNSTIAGDEKGRQNLANIGTGKGYYISEGYAIPITWEKKTRSGQTKYYYESGEELMVNDGNTFIEIQPINQSLEIE